MSRTEMDTPTPPPRRASARTLCPRRRMTFHLRDEAPNSDMRRRRYFARRKSKYGMRWRQLPRLVVRASHGALLKRLRGGQRAGRERGRRRPPLARPGRALPGGGSHIENREKMGAGRCRCRRMLWGI